MKMMMMTMTMMPRIKMGEKDKKHPSVRKDGQCRNRGVGRRPWCAGRSSPTAGNFSTIAATKKPTTSNAKFQIPNLQLNLRMCKELKHHIRSKGGQHLCGGRDIKLNWKSAYLDGGRISFWGVRKWKRRRDMGNWFTHPFEWAVDVFSCLLKGNAFKWWGSIRNRRRPRVLIIIIVIIVVSIASALMMSHTPYTCFQQVYMHIFKSGQFIHRNIDRQDLRTKTEQLRA